jgi:archaellum component FlaG (FlaF/FlaG flagellin family)
MLTAGEHFTVDACDLLVYNNQKSSIKKRDVAMKKVLYILIVAINALLVGCAGIGLVSSPDGDSRRIVGENIRINYTGNYILQNIPALGSTPACGKTFFDVVLAIKNTGTEPLTIKPEDFTISVDDGLVLTPLTRQDYCQKFHTEDCPSAVLRLQKLKKKDERAWSMSMAMNNNKIAACTNNFQAAIIGEEGYTIEPGKARIAMWLVFHDKRFNKRYFYEHTFEVKYRDLPPFVLADEDYWEIQQEMHNAPVQILQDNQ